MLCGNYQSRKVSVPDGIRGDFTKRDKKADITIPAGNRREKLRQNRPDIGGAGEGKPGIYGEAES